MKYQVEVSKPYKQKMEVKPNYYARVKFVNVAVPSIGFNTQIEVSTREAMLAQIKKQIAAFLEVNKKEILEIEV